MISNFPPRPIRNRGGYVSFDFIPYLDIQSFPSVENHTVNPALILLHPGKWWFNGYATAETLAVIDEPDKNANGTSFALKVNGVVPGDSPALTNLMFEMETQRFVVRLTDTRGKIKIIGSPAYPLEFKATFSSGDQRSSAKGFTMQFFGPALHRALECVF